MQDGYVIETGKELKDGENPFFYDCCPECGGFFLLEDSQKFFTHYDSMHL
jgi:hypothetical protein